MEKVTIRKEHPRLTKAGYIPVRRHWMGYESSDARKVEGVPIGMRGYTGLANALAGAKLVIKDVKGGLWLAWHGGHGVHAYDKAGREQHFWNTGDSSKDAATEAEVRKSMHEKIMGGYP